MAAHGHKSPVIPLHAVWAETIKALLEKPHSRVDLASRAGVRDLTMGYMLQAMRLPETRCLYVSGHRQDSLGRWTTPLYSLGDLPDVPRPEPMRRDTVEWRVKQQVYRAKKKAAADALAAEVAARAARVEDPAYIRSVQRTRSKIRQHAEEV